MFDATKYKNEYNKEKYYNAKIKIPKEKKEVLDALAKSTGKSINRLFVEAVEKVHSVDLGAVNCRKCFAEKISILKELGVSRSMLSEFATWFDTEYAVHGNTEELMRKIEQKSSKLIHRDIHRE